MKVPTVGAGPRYAVELLTLPLVAVLSSDVLVRCAIPVVDPGAIGQLPVPTAVGAVRDELNLLTTAPGHRDFAGNEPSTPAHVFGIGSREAAAGVTVATLTSWIQRIGQETEACRVLLSSRHRRPLFVIGALLLLHYQRRSNLA